MDPPPWSKSRKVEKDQNRLFLHPPPPTPRGRKVENSEKLNKIDHLYPSPQVEKSKIEKIQQNRQFRPSPLGQKVEKSKIFYKIDHLDPPLGRKVEK